MPELTVVSLMSEAARPAHAGIAAWLAARLGVGVHFVEGLPWHEQQAMLDAGEVDLAFICGLPYTRRAERLEALAAPVQAGARYGGRPVYFSDVVVRSASPYTRFEELRGARWAYNEPGSLSGYAVAQAHLAAIGAADGFFGRAVESGAHLASLRMVVAGEADAAAIDSTVLDLALRDEPGLGASLRVVEALGPNPAPPLVAARSLPDALRTQIRAALGAAHQDEAGRRALALAAITRFAPVCDADYEPVRRLARQAQGVAFT
jgi:phosphonate transport system substrate-binding protein